MRTALVGAFMMLWTGVHAQSPVPISREISPTVIVHRDRIYASYADRDLLLDLYMPAERHPSPLPAILVIRGGGWAQGDKEGFGPMAAALAERGFAAASIEYRASGEAVFPAAVEDTKAAVRWLRANAEEFGLDAQSIGAIGGSAGAHLALYLGVTANDRKLEGVGGNASYSSAISAVVGLAAPGDFPALRRRNAAASPIERFVGVAYDENARLWRDASPVTHISPASPPTLLIQSETDNVVPFDQSVQLARSFGAAGVPVELVLIPGAPHAFWNFAQWFDGTMDRAAQFFGTHLPSGHGEKP